jgi:cyclophilin family peptidyl-prolyl cis-trans isomerase
MIRRTPTAAAFVALVALAQLAAACGGDDGPAASVADAPPECPATDGSSAQRRTFTAPFPGCIDTSTSYAATITTSLGEIVVALDADAAPGAVDNFVSLARFKFFDDTTIHRVAQDFVIQGGSPDGTGFGGPGYAFPDELPSTSDVYTAGSLAMANSGPNSNGSQWFIVLDDRAVQILQPLYTRFGEVTSGMDVVAAIGALVPPSGDGAPVQPVEVESIVITEN